MTAAGPSDARSAPRDHPAYAVKRESRSPRRVLRRHLLGLVAAAALAGVGVPVGHLVLELAAGFIGLRSIAGVSLELWRRSRMRRGRRDRPSEPWTWDDRWDERAAERPVGRTQRGWTSIAWGLGLVAVACVLMTLPNAWLFAVAFGLPGAGLALQGIFDLRAGKLRVCTTQTPAFTGGRVDVVIGVSDDGARFEMATVVLRCLEERAHWRRPVWCTWSMSKNVPRDEAPGPGNDALVTFDVPVEARGTELDADDACWWEVEIIGITDAASLRERFVVPIYARLRGAAPSPA
jgi:hypothetical protein